MAATRASDLEMFVIDVLRHDIEQVRSILNLLNAADPIGWRDVWGRDFEEAEVLDALQRLVARGLVGLAVLSPDRYELVDSDMSDFRGVGGDYWFVLKEEGRDEWERWEPPPPPEERD